jgi:hypothetical protein
MEQIQIKQRPITELIGAEYNPRQITDKQFEQLKDSLKRFGFVDPVLVNMHPDRENIIVGGHMRTKAAQSLGYSDVPCVELNLTLEQEKELNIRLNKSGGTFDFDMLANYFETDELKDWGFQDWEFGTQPDTGNTNMLETVNKGDENDEWVGMPEFEQGEKDIKVIIYFLSERERETYCEEKEIEITKKQNNQWISRL